MMVSKRRRAHRAAGEVPGTIVVEPDAEAPQIRAVGYSQTDAEFRDLELDEVSAFVEKWPVAWIDVVGLGDAEIIAGMGEMFGLHPLVLEDIAHPHERAKVEEYEEHLFVLARMAHQEELQVHVEQFSLVVGDGWVVTFQEHQGDCLEPVRGRIRHGRGRIRRSQADYLAYALLDALTDAYFPVLDEFSRLMDRLEDRVIAGEKKDMLETLHDAKRALEPIRRAVMPLRDVVRFLELESGTRISDDTRVYLRDVADHVSIIVERLENLRDLGSSLMDVHYTVMSTRLNEVMQVLTVIATVFMPLSFVAGLYGMNFDTSSPYNMPELAWRYGYPFVWAVMLAMVVGMMYFFRRKGWF